MPSIESLQPSEYTADERRVLIDFLIALRKTHILGFLKRVDVPGSGTKADLREGIQLAVDEGRITYEEIVEFLDSLAPSPASPATGLDPEGWYTPTRLAEIYYVGKEALRKRLNRYREHNDIGWKENEDRRPRESKYHYRLRDVRQIIDSLRASNERPAKQNLARRSSVRATR